MNWNAFKRLFHYLGRYKLRLILVMIAAVLSTLFTVLTPAVTGGITSELYDGVASGSFDWETIVWLLVTLIALYLVAQLFAILQSFSMTKLTACVMETLRGDIDRKMHHLKLDYYDSHTQGEILSTITNDVDTVNNALSQNLTQIVTQVVTAVGILVMMFTTSPILTAIAVAMVPVSLLASLGVMKTGTIHYARQQELLGQLNGYIEEVYQGQELVSVFNYTDRAKEEFDRINGELQRTAQSAEIASGKVTPITDLVNNLGYAVSALLGCLSVLRGEMRIGDVQAMLQYTKQFSQPFTSIAGMAGSFSAASAAAGRRSQADRQGTARLGGQGNRPDRQAQGHPLWREPAQDAVRQDHAPPAAQPGQGRADHAGHDDAGKPRHPGAAGSDLLIIAPRAAARWPLRFWWQNRHRGRSL